MDIQQAARELKQPHVQEALKVVWASADRRIFDLFTTDEAAATPEGALYYRQLYDAMAILKQATNAVISRGSDFEKELPKRP